MERKVKMGTSARFLVGIVFTVVGCVFLILSIALTGWAEEAEVVLVGKIYLPIGGVFFLLGVSFLLADWIKRRRAQKMLDEGCFLWARIIRIQPNWNVTINGRHPCMAVVSARDSRDVEHIFKSASYMKLREDMALIGCQIKVYYEDETYRCYYVDVQELMSNTIEH